MINCLCGRGEWCEMCTARGPSKIKMLEWIKIVNFPVAGFGTINMAVSANKDIFAIEMSRELLRLTPGEASSLHQTLGELVAYMKRDE